MTDEIKRNNKPENSFLWDFIKTLIHIAMFIVIVAVSAISGFVYMFSRPAPSMDPMVDMVVDLSVPGEYSGEMIVDQSQKLCGSELRFFIRTDREIDYNDKCSDQLSHGVVMQIYSADNNELLFERKELSVGNYPYWQPDEETGCSLKYDNTLRTNSDIPVGNYNIKFIVNAGVEAFDGIKQELFVKPFYCRTCHAFRFMGTATLIFIFLFVLLAYVWYKKLSKYIFACNNK